MAYDPFNPVFQFEDHRVRVTLHQRASTSDVRRRWQRTIVGTASCDVLSALEDMMENTGMLGASDRVRVREGRHAKFYFKMRAIR